MANRLIFVVKVQLAIGGDRGDRVLVYNRDRTIEWEGDASAEIRAEMAGEPKRFFYAHLNRERRIVLDGPAPWQDW